MNMDESTENEPKEAMDLGSLVRAALVIEKLRVATEVRQTHLTNQGRVDPETDELHRLVKNLEDYVDGRVAHFLKEHPAYHWFSRVKGVGKENIGKVVGLLDIHRAPTISSFWMYAGLAPENGKTMKRTPGEKLRYNSQLRSMCWRLGVSLKMAGGKFYTYYVEEKTSLEERCARDGILILPTPTGKWACSHCGKSFAKKADITPCCDDQKVEKAVKKEPVGVMWKGHVDMMAVRKMLKLFLSCLWREWAKAEGIPVRDPYPIAKLGHSRVISPWDMVDR